LKNKITHCTNIVVVGGGFIGVEVAEQLAKHPKKKVSLIEMEKYCLIKAFSEDIAERADNVIRQTDVNLFTRCMVKKIIGENGKVKAVELDNGKFIDAELVIMAIGYKPEIELAKNAGLPINEIGAITVDTYMRTGINDIFAVGDCSSKCGFITNRTDNIMLALLKCI